MVKGGKSLVANQKATLIRYVPTAKGWRHCPVVLTSDPPMVGEEPQARRRYPGRSGLENLHGGEIPVKNEVGIFRLARVGNACCGHDSWYL
jgi:hypothetical protein